MTTNKGTLLDLLDNLTGSGIYDITLVEYELPPFGFAYERDDDTLHYGGRSTKLGARSPQIAGAEDDDTAIDPGRAGDLVLDATDLTKAIIRLIAPDDPIPSEGFYSRARAYRADVDLIRRRWRTN